MTISEASFRSATAFIICAVSLLLTRPVLAHHSYAMFDGSRTITVSGTVAKLEWMNPHVYVWVYVRNASNPKGYDLYAFENGSTNVLARRGWSKNTMTVGEKITVEYWPLKDGRTGGHFLKATHADGHVSRGIGGPKGANAAAGLNAAPAPSTTESKP